MSRPQPKKVLTNKHRISDGDSIAPDVGTTITEVARHLSSKKQITVITPSFRIARILTEQGGLDLS